jgi:hypothetical protein
MYSCGCRNCALKISYTPSTSAGEWKKRYVFPHSLMSGYNYVVSFWVDLTEPTPQTHQRFFLGNSQRKIRDDGKNNRSV